MKLLIATSNPHKLDEIRAVLQSPDEDPQPAVPLEICSLADVSEPIAPPQEDGQTFEANAALKARYYAEITGMWCLADDSGLAVDALDGEPGVYSARYAGHPGPRHEADPANNAHLLRKLADTPGEQRTARFVCAMALHAPGESAARAVVRGTVEGRILGPGDPGYAIDNPAGRGEHGFGYDPLFLLPALGKTTAELHPEHKNALSHRGQATRKLREHLMAILRAGGA